MKKSSKHANIKFLSLSLSFPPTHTYTNTNTHTHTEFKHYDEGLKVDNRNKEDKNNINYSAYHSITGHNKQYGIIILNLMFKCEFGLEQNQT